MKKQDITKTIKGMIIFVFVISFFQFTLPIQAATNTGMSGFYDNPNQSSNNTYKFKISDVVSSGLLTNVVGCTGIVNKVSTWMIKFIQSPAKQAEIAADGLKKLREQLKSTCAATKVGAETGAGTIPFVNDLVSAIKTMFSTVKVGEVTPCKDQIDTTSDEELAAMAKQAKQDYEKNLKEQCFDGIAITLAKNQLTAMTRSMMNWVNSGYGGNPFFVQNMRNFTNNIERNVLETGIDILLSPGNQNPYASDFARSTITNRGLVSGSANFLGNLQSNLESFIADPKSYYTNGQLDRAQDTRNALQRAQDANYAFQNDFSVGGWNAYLALTQIDQNNPLGFNVQASQYLANTQAQQISDAKDELAQNNGFMSQKTCILWKVIDENGSTTFDEANNKIKTTTTPDNNDECSDWKIITPGSIIKEKTTNYLNSPERQLELAKTINDSLNALFSVLISKLQGGGLSGLSDSWVNTTNWTDNMNDLVDSTDGNTPYDNNGAYDGFNLTRDLGNTYIHDTTRSLGTWNAKTNTTATTKTLTNGKKLYPTLAPEDYDSEGKTISSNNTYYTVNTTGSTNLLLEGYNGWEVGDRAFWNGSEWQNWKKDQTNPIKKRGVVQIQQDYIIAGKEILKILPSIMTKLGELDYCIPGPNPSYKTNSTNAQSAYQSWVGSMYVGIVDVTGSRYGVKIDNIGGRTYDNLQNIYADSSQVWNSIRNEVKSLYNMPYLISSFSNICNSKEKDCTGNYFYEPGELTRSDADHLKEKTDLMNKVLDYANNRLFQNFYTTFDEAMNKLYFNNMPNKYLETESSSALTENKGYIPMASSGLGIVKNIKYYDEEITKATQDYTDAINQAKVNIAALEPIKTEVSGIIKAAQDRRNERLVTLLGLTIEEIQTKYATCFAEENIQFYDADTIINTGSIEGERCFNKIDDDLDGLIDEKDPDCQGIDNGMIYYRIQNCKDNQTYSTGPYPSGTYGSGSRVLGSTNNYYVVTGSQTTPISGVNNIVTSGTGMSGCSQ